MNQMMFPATKFVSFGVALLTLSLVSGCNLATFSDDKTVSQPSCDIDGIAENDRQNADVEELRLLSEAKVHFQERHYGFAETGFRKLLDTYSNASHVGSRVVRLEAMLGLAASYDHLKRFDLADNIYSQIKSEFGESAVYFNNYEYSLRLRGEPEKAKSLYQRASAILPQCQAIFQ